MLSAGAAAMSTASGLLTAARDPLSARLYQPGARTGQG